MFDLSLTAWLLATMNVGKVQPSGYVSHLVSEEEDSRRPFVAADGLADSDSEAELYVTTSTGGINGLNNKRYGADD